MLVTLLARGVTRHDDHAGGHDCESCPRVRGASLKRSVRARCGSSRRARTIAPVAPCSWWSPCIWSGAGGRRF